MKALAKLLFVKQLLFFESNNLQDGVSDTISMFSKQKLSPMVMPSKAKIVREIVSASFIPNYVICVPKTKS